MVITYFPIRATTRTCPRLPLELNAKGRYHVYLTSALASPLHLCFCRVTGVLIASQMDPCTHAPRFDRYVSVS